MFLLLGSNTIVGQAFAAQLRQRGQRFVPVRADASDIADVNTLFEHVRRVSPAFVINAGSITRSGNSELTRPEKEEAIRTNVLLPQTLARVCQMRNIPWGHVSSGTIYRGAKIRRKEEWLVEIDLLREDVRHAISIRPECVRGFAENDDPNHCFLCPPCDFYSGTIALGERAIEAIGGNYTWRPGLLFDGTTEAPKHRPTEALSHRTTEAPKHRTTEPPFHTTPASSSPRPSGSLVSVTNLGEFVAACLDLWDRRAPFGTYHVVNAGLVNTADLLPFGLNNSAAPLGISNQDAKSNGVPLPQSFFLDGSKLARTGINLRPARTAVASALERLSDERCRAE